MYVDDKISNFRRHRQQQVPRISGFIRHAARPQSKQEKGTHHRTTGARTCANHTRFTVKMTADNIQTQAKSLTSFTSNTCTLRAQIVGKQRRSLCFLLCQPRAVAPPPYLFIAVSPIEIKCRLAHITMRSPSARIYNGLALALTWEIHTSWTKGSLSSPQETDGV